MRTFYVAQICLLQKVRDFNKLKTRIRHVVALSTSK